MFDIMLDELTSAFLNRNDHSHGICRRLVDQLLDALESGHVRCAHKSDDGWQVDERVKTGILLAFRVGQKEIVAFGPLTFIDKDNLWPRTFTMSDEVRLLPGGATVRRGAYVGKNVILMSPSYVNIGAYIDEGSLVDSNALVGSCAQIGKRVHISAGAQVGGVLEPINASPVIIEDDVLVGGNCGIYEGCVIKEKAVLGAGLILTKSTKVFDLVHETVISANEQGTLTIPSGAVLVPGARSIKTDFAREHGLSVTTPLIVKYRDDKTNKKAELEALLR